MDVADRAIGGSRSAGLGVVGMDATMSALDIGQADEFVLDETAPIAEELRAEPIRQASLTVARVDVVREHQELLRFEKVGATLLPPLTSAGSIGRMKTAFVAGFGPITRDTDAARGFWERGLGIGLEEAAPGYFTNDDLDGVKAFALWPLSQAAEAVFGSTEWPADIPEPQAWMELDVESAQAVGAAISEMEAAGHRVLRGAHEEPWGQTTARLLSPEGLLVGITFTPWMHEHTHDEDPITES